MGCGGYRHQIANLNGSYMKTVSIVAQGGSFASYIQECTDKGGVPPSDEVWTVNAMGGVIKHDLLFHMDDCKVQESRPNRNIHRMMGWLKEHPKFMTSTAYPDYPGAIEYPLEDVVNCIGVPYLNGTVAYALAYAIYQEFDGIRLYGADFSYAHVHKAERGRGCVEFLLGVAMSRGIALHLPKYTTLMDTCEPWNIKMYGYDAWDIDWDVTEEGLVLKKQPKPLPPGEAIEELYLTKEKQNAKAMGVS